jgi:hypothetical protein
VKRFGRPLSPAEVSSVRKIVDKQHDVMNYENINRRAWKKTGVFERFFLHQLKAALLMSIVVLATPISAIADKNDCNAHRSGSKESRACIESVDKKNDKRAKTIVIDKPTTVARNVSSKKQMETELRSKSGQPLHATKHKYDFSKEAKEHLAMNQKRRGG